MAIRKRPGRKPKPPVPEVPPPPIMPSEIQLAIDALPPDGGVVFVAPGTHNLDFPLRVSKTKVTLQGAGRETSVIVSTGRFEGPIAVYGAPFDNIPTAPSLAAGPGSSMVMDNTNQYYLNLRDSTTMDIDGLPKFCLELFYRPTKDTTGQFFLQNIIASQGVRLGFEGMSKTFSLDHFEGNKLRASLNVGGSLKSLSSPSPLRIGQVHHVALTYDGSMVRLFINGSNVSSTSANGSISQQPHEDVTLGVAIQDWPETTLLDIMTKGEVDGLRISRVERYTSNFVPPISKPVSDSDTLLLLNFDVFQDIFVKATSTPGGLPIWLATRRTSVPTFMGESKLRDLKFHGNGPYFFSCTNSRFEDVAFTTNTTGVFLRNSSYLNTFRNVKCFTSSSINSRGGLIMGSAGALTFDEVQVTGGAYPLVSAGGSAYMNSVIVSPNQYTRIPIILKGRTGGNSQYNMDQLLVDDEPHIPPGFVRPIETHVALDDVTANFYGGTIEMVTAVPGPRSNVWIDKSDASFFGTRFPNLSSDVIVRFKSPTASRKVAIRDCYKPDPNAWADDLSKCLIENSS